MSGAQRIIGFVGSLLVVALLVGLTVRRRHQQCYAFSAYLITILVADLLTILWPERFYRIDFWLAKESLQGLAKFAVAVELAVRTFRAFPGARATARRVIFVVLVMGLIAVLSMPGGALKEMSTVADTLLPRVLNGTIWVFAAIAALILWYRLPVDAWHKAILVGFVPFLLVFALAQNSLKTLGWDWREYTNYASTLAYVTLLSYWTYAAWRSEEPSRPLPRPLPARLPA
jgi:hypothetical protein